MELKTLLKNQFGYDEFRQGQEEIIQYILAGQNVLGIMPTGGGKSICYQLPALLLEGLTLVVSPLISLMKDQVDALQQMGIPAAFIHSGLSRLEMNKRFKQAAQGEIKMLYIAPERLESADFQQLLDHVSLSLLAIDEAHCISQWGHDFRPSYLNLLTTIQKFQEPPVIIALTATATPDVAKNIAELLEIPKSNFVETGFARENLTLKVVKDQNKENYLVEYLKMNRDESGIIYVSTRKEAEKVYHLLNSMHLSVGLYHAGLKEEERNFNQEEFLFDRTQVMVATNAFGMGINKSNIRYVLHYQIPGDLESYYQEAGRAGRDGLDSEIILLFAPQDVRVRQYFIEVSQQEDTYKKIAYRKLREMVQYVHTQSCLQQYILRYFGETSSACNNCEHCLDDREFSDITLDAQKILSCVKRMGERFGKGFISKVLTGSKDKKVQQWQFDQLSTYGIMKQQTQKEVLDLIDYLTAEQYFFLDTGEYPILKIAEAGVKVLRGEKKVKRKQARKVVKITDTSALFEKLRELRSDLAQEQNVPPYLIFSDHTLQEMCAYMPRNRLELLQIKGVGQNKLEKYGRLFLQILEAYQGEPMAESQEVEKH